MPEAMTQSTWHKPCQEVFYPARMESDPYKMVENT